MNTAERRQVKENLSIAQCVARSSDPHHAAVTSFTRRECPHGQNKHVYFFEDGSEISFLVSYSVISSGDAE